MCVSGGVTEIDSSLIQVMARCQLSNKPLLEQMVANIYGAVFYPWATES